MSIFRHENREKMIIEFQTFPPASSWKRRKLLSSEGRSINLTIGLKNWEVDVFTVTVLIKPSAPGCSSTTRAKGHWVGAVLSFLMRTKDPISMLDFSWRHLFLTWTDWMYSLCHVFQKSSLTLLTSRHLCNWPILTPTLDLSGKDFRPRPIFKWPGVSELKSEGSSVKGHNGREFRHDYYSKVDRSAQCLFRSVSETMNFDCATWQITYPSWDFKVR